MFDSTFTTTIIKDTVHARSGFLDTDWTVYSLDNIVYFLLGLFATYLYFWFVVRANKIPPNTIKEFFKIRDNQNKLYQHLIFYMGFIVLWILMGISEPARLLGEPSKFAFSLITMDISEKILGAYSTINDIFPKGKLSAVTIILGGGMTFLIRNAFPAIWSWLKDFFKKKS